MPLFISKTVFESAKLGVWKIEEDKEYFLKQLSLSEDERQLVGDMKGRRPIEWLSSRHLVHIMSERSKRAIILKDEHGKPYIKDSDHHISFSHSHGMAAAIASPDSVGIDIQFVVPKITRITKKFINNSEWKEIDLFHSSTHLDLFHIIWGAKESLYKAYGIRSLDFKAHMQVSNIEWDGQYGECNGEIRKEEYNEKFSIFAQKIQNHILVYAQNI